MKDDREIAIRFLIDELQRMQSDVDPFLERHTSDTVIVNFGGRRVLGRDALRTAMEAALASPLADVTTTNEIHDIRFLRPDVAIVSCTKHVKDARESETPLASAGSLTYVLVENGGAWRVALAQTTPIA